MKKAKQLHAIRVLERGAFLNALLNQWEKVFAHHNESAPHSFQKGFCVYCLRPEEFNASNRKEWAETFSKIIADKFGHMSE